MCCVVRVLQFRSLEQTLLSRSSGRRGKVLLTVAPGVESGEIGGLELVQ